MNKIAEHGTCLKTYIFFFDNNHIIVYTQMPKKMSLKNNVWKSGKVQVIIAILNIDWPYLWYFGFWFIDLVRGVSNNEWRNQEY